MTDSTARAEAIAEIRQSLMTMLRCTQDEADEAAVLIVAELAGDPAVAMKAIDNHKQRHPRLDEEKCALCGWFVAAQYHMTTGRMFSKDFPLSPSGARTT